MKKTLILALVLSCARPAFALFGLGDVVFDPTQYGFQLSHEIKELAHWAEEIKKYEDFILKQQEQITRIREVANINGQIKEKIGDWQGVYDRAMSIKLHTDQITKSYITNLNLRAFVDYGQTSLGYTNRGNYGEVNIRTAYGTPALIDEQRFRRYKSIETLYEDLQTIFEKTDADVKGLKEEIAQTSEDSAKATSVEQTAKLQNKLIALQSQLGSLEAQRREQVERVLAQKALNENQAAKEAEVAQAVTHQTMRDQRAADAKGSTMTKALR